MRLTVYSQKLIRGQPNKGNQQMIATRKIKEQENIGRKSTQIIQQQYR